MSECQSDVSRCCWRSELHLSCPVCETTKMWMSDKNKCTLKTHFHNKFPKLTTGLVKIQKITTTWPVNKLLSTSQDQLLREQGQVPSHHHSSKVGFFVFFFFSLAVIYLFSLFESSHYFAEKRQFCNSTPRFHQYCTLLIFPVQWRSNCYSSQWCKYEEEWLNLK